MRLDVRYWEAEIKPELDKAIEKAISSIGGRWYSSGYNNAMNYREMVFDYPRDLFEESKE